MAKSKNTPAHAGHLHANGHEKSARHMPNSSMRHGLAFGINFDGQFWTRLKNEFRWENVGLDSDTVYGRLDWVKAFAGSGTGLFCRIRNDPSAETTDPAKLAADDLRLKRVRYTVTTLMLIMLAWSMGFYWQGGSWIYFITNWSLLFVTCYLVCASICTHYYHDDLASDRGVVERVPLFVKLTWILNMSALTIAFIVTILFWAMVATGFHKLPPGGSAYTAVIDHGLHLVLLLVEFNQGATPFLLLHALFASMTFCAAYIAFAAMFSLRKWDNPRYRNDPEYPDGAHFVYPPLDYNQPNQVFVWGVSMALIFVIAPMVSLIIWGTDSNRRSPWFKNTETADGEWPDRVNREEHVNKTGNAAVIPAA